AHQAGRSDIALELIGKAVRQNPKNPLYYSNFGEACRLVGRIDDAIAACHTAINLNPNFPDAFNNLGLALKDKGQLDEAIAAYRTALQLKPTSAVAHSNLLFTMHLSADYDRQTLYQAHQQWNQQHAQPLSHLIQPHTNDRSPERRLK